jgi:Carboxypeptidase regulatory-like domain
MPRLCRALLLLGVLISASTAFAQSGLGSITGTLLDTTGGRLPGAEVKVVETSTGATRTTISNEAGLFNLASVPPGTYTISISLDHFKTKQLDNITLNSFQKLSLGEVSLEVSVSPTDVVEVTAPRPQLDIDSGVRT